MSLRIRDIDYLIIDKEQRLTGKRSTASKRLIEEIEKKDMECDFMYYDSLKFLFKDGTVTIKAYKKDIREYKHIIFRGHSLHDNKEYHFKRYIVDYIDLHNLNNPSDRILVQNSEAIKNFPYYNKIAMAMFCAQHNIPYFNTYYRADGKYLQDRDMLKNYPLILKEYTGANRIKTIGGKEKIKKNVFKIEKDEDFKKVLDQPLSNFFLQELSDTGEDYRIFVKLGKVIGGWKRKATDGFMTVKKGEYTMYNNPDQEIVDIAEKVATLLSADFMAVDFMYINNKPHVQEISFHPGFKAYETKIEGKPVNIAKAIITAFRG
jgi:glutathione synthase/RimK-type ligase-like ATP-grasp enzyme